MVRKAEHWGRLLAEGETPDAEGIPLVWLPDVVAHCQKTRPSRPALRYVVQQLQGKSNLKLFRLVKGDWAEPVSNDTVLREARPHQPEHDGLFDNRVNPDGSMKRSVSMGREPETIRRHVPEQKAVSEIRGISGVLSWLSDELGPTAATRLYEFPCGRVALLASDAAELFGFGVEPPARPAPVVQLVSPPCPDPAPKVHPDAWTDEELEAMRANRATMSDGAIGEKYGITRQRVGQLLGPAYRDRPPAKVKAGTGGK